MLCLVEKKKCNIRAGSIFQFNKELTFDPGVRVEFFIITKDNLLLIQQSFQIWKDQIFKDDFYRSRTLPSGKVPLSIFFRLFSLAGLRFHCTTPLASSIRQCFPAHPLTSALRQTHTVVCHVVLLYTQNGNVSRRKIYLWQSGIRDGSLFTGGIFLSGYAGQEASGVRPMWKTGQKQSYKPA